MCSLSLESRADDITVFLDVRAYAGAFPDTEAAENRFALTLFPRLFVSCRIIGFWDFGSGGVYFFLL